MKHFEKELPEGYREVFSIDATDSKTGLILNVVALVIFAAIAVPAFFIIRPTTDFFDDFSIARNFIALVVMIVYMILHELVHGLAYKLLTKQKLKFGLTMTCAYCGVPDIYVYRTAALIALLAPFFVFTIVFAVPLFLPIGAWDKVYCAIILAIHIGGCVGDLYDTGLYIFKFKSPETLMRDTGPKQSFYLK